MKYRAIFSNFKGTVDTEISDNLPEYFYPVIIDSVTIETDGFGVLTIDNSEQYSESQLALFEYEIEYPYKDKAKKLLVLKNYQLKVFIPIRILEIKSGKRITSEVQITISNNGGKNVKRECSLFGKSSENYDLEVAFGELQKQLIECYCMETCSNCKNSWWSIYGGNEFCNHLCFKSEAEAFQTIKDKDKMSVAHFMKYGNDKNWQSVELTDYCDKFEAR